MEARLKELYKTDIQPALLKQFGYQNAMEAPRLEKIVVNIGVGEAAQDSKLLDSALADLTAITGQKPAIRRAKQAISNFKLRKGLPVGCMVTLRGIMMYEFLERLVNFALPQLRDFRGISRNSFDGRGNYNMGLKEQIIFPEVDYDKIDQIRGLDIAIVTTAQTDDEARELLALFGMPFSN
ncbi:MAG: 50S ribosomal protein L5 [Gemmatimonadetes bacterium]|nr:50S ribosomal protein L5 [Gemmatimonadota bacterium]|tara:strand:- start:580 stop:1122 length:543 start_codon:yes stop_codon:yes gene_type:complete